MALDYAARYPAQIATDAAYPQGKARNVATTGDGTGTPWEADLINDLFGLEQAALLEGTVDPSGSPDTATSSQLLEGIRKAVWGPMCVSNWESTITAAIDAVCWSPDLNIFCGVGTNGAIATSPNGDAWTVQTAADAATDFKAICWAPAPVSKFVAVGVNGSVIETSADGVTWAAQSPDTATTFDDVTWSPTNNLLCAVGGEGIETSPTGSTWTSRALVSDLDLWSIAWSEDLGMFAGWGMKDEFGGLPYPFYSSNGTAWAWGTKSTTPAGASLDSGVVWCQALNIFVGVVGEGVATSTDGIDWTVQAFAAPTGVTLRSIAYSDELGQMVAVGDNGKFYSSRDGVAWTERYQVYTDNAGVTWLGVTFGRGAFVATAGGGVLRSMRAGT